MSNNLVNSSHATEAKIRGFKKKEIGWHFGEGEPPTESTISLALEFNREFLGQGFSKTNAFPGVWGEIEICGYQQKDSIAFIIECDGSVSASFERSGEEIVSKENLSPKEALRLLKSWSRKIFNIFDGLVENIGIPNWGDLEVWPSTTPAPIEAFPYSNLNVQFLNPEGYVNTLQNFMVGAQFALLFSGLSPTTHASAATPLTSNSMRKFAIHATTI